jgi:hypothetical protein
VPLDMRHQLPMVLVRFLCIYSFVPIHQAFLTRFLAMLCGFFTLGPRFPFLSELLGWTRVKRFPTTMHSIYR